MPLSLILWSEQFWELGIVKVSEPLVTVFLRTLEYVMWDSRIPQP